MNAQPGPTVKKVASTPASYEQDADIYLMIFFKSIPEESLLGGPHKLAADLLRGFSFKFNQVQETQLT